MRFVAVASRNASPCYRTCYFYNACPRYFLKFFVCNSRITTVLRVTIVLRCSYRNGRNGRNEIFEWSMRTPIATDKILYFVNCLLSGPWGRTLASTPTVLKFIVWAWLLLWWCPPIVLTLAEMSHFVQHKRAKAIQNFVPAALFSFSK